MKADEQQNNIFRDFGHIFCKIHYGDTTGLREQNNMHAARDLNHFFTNYQQG